MAYETKSRVIPDPERYRVIIRKSNGDKRLIYTGRLLHDVSSKLGEKSGEFADSVPTPQNLVAEGSKESITITWDSVVGHGGLLGYKLYREGTLIKTLSDTSYEDTDVSVGVVYTYYVEAYDIYGDTSDPSNPDSASLVTEDAAPYDLAADPGNTQVALTWKFDEAADFYRVYMDSAVVKDGHGSKSATIQNLTNGVTYAFTVTAVRNGVESPMSNIVFAVPRVEATGEIWTLDVNEDVVYHNDVFNNDFNSGVTNTADGYSIKFLIGPDEIVLGKPNGVIEKRLRDGSTVVWTEGITGLGSYTLDKITTDGDGNTFGVVGGYVFGVDKDGNELFVNQIEDFGTLGYITVVGDELYIAQNGFPNKVYRVNKSTGGLIQSHELGENNGIRLEAYIGNYIYGRFNSTSIGRLSIGDITNVETFFSISGEDIYGFTFNTEGALICSYSTGTQAVVQKYTWSGSAYTLTYSITLSPNFVYHIIPLAYTDYMVLDCDSQSVLLEDTGSAFVTHNSIAEESPDPHPGKFYYYKQLRDLGVGATLDSR